MILPQNFGKWIVMHDLIENNVIKGCNVDPLLEHTRNLLGDDWQFAMHCSGCAAYYLIMK